MQERKITLIDIGAGALPSVTPVTAQNSSWFPTVYVSAETPPVDGVTPEPVADGVLIEWDAVDQAGAVYIIERGASQNGPWTEIHRTTETRYLYSDGSGQKWFFRITASVRGKPGQGTVVEATPAPTTAELVAAQQKLDKEIVDRVLADSNEAASRARDIGLVNAGLVQEAQARVTQIGQAMDAVAAESRTRATQLLNEKMEREAAITAVSETQQNGFDSLSRALSEVAAGSGTQFDSKTIWHFTTTVEGWGSNGGAPALNDGWLRPTNNSASYAQSPAALGIDGNAYRFMKLRMRRTGNPVWLGLVRWTTEADQAWNDGKSTTVAPPAFDAAGVATVDISDIPWSGPSPIRQVRIALTRGQTINDYVEYDYIAIGRPAPGASVALVQEETQARVTALASEATQRNTLAVQMRGNYTGTDLSQAQGLMGDERTARAAADSSQVQRITTMEARMPAGSGGLATSALVTTLQDAMVAADQANAQATTRVSSDLRAALSRSLNLVINGDLVNDLAGWQVSGGQPGAWTVSATEGRGGGKCLKGTSIPFGVATSAQANLNEGIEVKVGRRYRLRAWVKVSTDYVGDIDNSKIRVGAVRTDGTEVLLWSRVYNAGWTNWTLVENVFTIAEGTVRFRLSAGLRNTAGYVLVDDFELVDVTDEEQIASTASGLSSLTTRTGVIEGTQNAQATLIGQVQSGLAQTNGNVTAAQQAAQTAADAAGAKGKVIYGAASPAATDRLPQNLWIDSNGNANTPKRWNGTAWAAVSDKAATDAAAAAAAAQQTANAAQSQASANAGALNTLDTKVTQLGNTVTALGEAVTTVNAQLDGLRTLGDNLIPNSNFSAGLRWWSLQTPFPVWSETAGDNRPGVTMTRTTSSNPAMGAMDAQWIPNRGARRYRAIVRAMGVSGAMNLMLRLQRQNRETLAVGYSDKQLTLTTSFTTYTVDFDAVDSTIGAVRLWAYNYPNNAVVRVDSIELYDVTDQLASEANAAATSTLTGKVTTLEGTTIAQGQAITSVNAQLTATQQAGANIMVDAGFEGFAADALISQSSTGTLRAIAGSAGARAYVGARAARLLRTGAPSNTNTDVYFGPEILTNEGRVYFVEAWLKNDPDAVAPGGSTYSIGVSGVNSAGARAWYSAPTTGTQRMDALANWTKISGYVTISNPTVKAQLWAAIQGRNGQTPQNVALLIDNVIWQDVTDAHGAKTTADAAATGLSALTTTVTQQGGQITALGQQVNQVGASVAGKADTSVVQTLTAMVKDTMTGGGNLLSNTLFKDGRRGWGWWNSGNGTWNELGLVAGPEWAPPGLAHFGGFAPSNLALNTQFWAGDEQPVPVVAGKRYCFSAYINCHRVGLAILISFRDANGNTVGEQYSGPADATNVRPPITLDRMKRLSASMVAPASAVYARVGFYLRGLGLSNNEGNYFWIFQPMLEEMREGQTGPSPYSAGGGETLAGYSLYVTADGLTGGMVTKNDGKVVDMKILANVLQILSPNQPDGIEMRDGYIRTWKGNSQRIIGNGFGVGGEGLIDYFGPNVGAAAASKANATVWMDLNGNAYWGGSLAAGVLRNAVQSTQTTTVGTQVVNGPFGSNGRNKSVVVGFSRRVNRVKNQYSPQGFVAGGGSNTCTVNIFRKVDNDPETFWTSFTAGGGVDVYNETDGPDIATSYWSGSVTLNDGSDGSRPRQYRAEIVGFSEQAVTHQSGTFDSQTINQSLSIVSTEV